MPYQPMLIGPMLNRIGSGVKAFDSTPQTFGLAEQRAGYLYSASMTERVHPGRRSCSASSWVGALVLGSPSARIPRSADEVA